MEGTETESVNMLIKQSALCIRSELIETDN